MICHSTLRFTKTADDHFEEEEQYHHPGQLTLNEGEEEAIRHYLETNPHTSDEEFHEFLDELGIDHDEGEEIAYELAHQGARLEQQEDEKGFRPDSEYDPHELHLGIKEEMEHFQDEELAKEIAKDHLDEDHLYYSHMEELKQSHGYFGGNIAHSSAEQEADGEKLSWWKPTLLGAGIGAGAGALLDPEKRWRGAAIGAGLGGGIGAGLGLLNRTATSAARSVGGGGTGLFESVGKSKPDMSWEVTGGPITRESIGEIGRRSAKLTDINKRWKSGLLTDEQALKEISSIHGSGGTPTNWPQTADEFRSALNDPNYVWKL